VIIHQDLVPGPKIEAAGDHVDRGGWVGEENHFVRLAAEVGGQFLSRGSHQIAKAAVHEFNRAALDFALPILVSFEDRARDGAKGAVIQKKQIRLDKKLGFQAGWHVGFDKRYMILAFAEQIGLQFADFYS
jgi:hypothetical protein